MKCGELLDRLFKRHSFAVNHLLRNPVYLCDVFRYVSYGLHECSKCVVDTGVAINPNRAYFNDLVPHWVKASRLKIENNESRRERCEIYRLTRRLTCIEWGRREKVEPLKNEQDKNGNRTDNQPRHITSFRYGRNPPASRTSFAMSVTGKIKADGFRRDKNRGNPKRSGFHPRLILGWTHQLR